MGRGAKPKKIIDPRTGEETTYKAIAEELGISTKALRLRIYRYGAEKAINNELFSKSKFKIIKHPVTGENTTYAKLQQEAEVAESTIRKRLKLFEAGKIEPVSVITKSKTGRDRKKYTNPLTNERGDAYYWAKRIGISATSFRARISQHGESKEAFKPYTRGQWTEEEDFFLCEIFEHPNLYRVWKSAAKKNQWKQRTLCAIELRIKLLKQEGYIKDDRRRYQDEDEWISPNHLANLLCTTHATVHTLIDKGLPATWYTKAQREKPRAKINKQKFVNWVLGEGIGIISQYLTSPSAIFWVLVQIQKYKAEVSQK